MYPIQMKLLRIAVFQTGIKECTVSFGQTEFEQLVLNSNAINEQKNRNVGL